MCFSHTPIMCSSYLCVFYAPLGNLQDFVVSFIPLVSLPQYLTQRSLEDGWDFRMKKRSLSHQGVKCCETPLYLILLNLNRWKLSKVEISCISQVRTLRFKCVKHPSEIPAHGMFTPGLGVSVEILILKQCLQGTTIQTMVVEPQTMTGWRVTWKSNEPRFMSCSTLVVLCLQNTLTSLHPTFPPSVLSIISKAKEWRW